MGSRKKEHHHGKKKISPERSAGGRGGRLAAAPAMERLEIVLKCDTAGCAEAVASAIASLDLAGGKISIISSGVGAVNKSDVFMAETGSRLIVGFNIGLMPHIDQMVVEHNVEIRLYEVIYKLLEDLESIARSLLPRKPQERILGSAKVIALFKSSRRGIIIGCEVLSGKLALGKSFRILSAMGPIYSGIIESLHIENDAIREAVKGQQVGLKISDFNRVRINDQVESFQAVSGQDARPWQPQGRIYYPAA